MRSEFSLEFHSLWDPSGCPVPHKLNSTWPTGPNPPSLEKSPEKYAVVNFQNFFSSGGGVRPCNKCTPITQPSESFCNW